MKCGNRERMLQILKGNHISVDLFKATETTIINSCKKCLVDFSAHQVVFSVFGGFAYIWVSDKEQMVLSLCLNKKIDNPIFYDYEKFSPSSYMYHTVISKESDLSDNLISFIKKAAEISRIQYFKQIV